MSGLILLIISYLSGSLPFGYLVAKKVKGIDIRDHGSGNIGATNVFRTAGRDWGILVFFLDFFKGFLPPLLGRYIFFVSGDYLLIAAAVLTVVGHTWPVFLKFKGGKGVATGLGAMWGLAAVFPGLWKVLLLAVIVWIFVFSVFRYVSLASILACFSFAVLVFLFGQPLPLKITAVSFFVLILLRHRENISKLVKGKEHRFK
ncbi:MAG: glycerol-3-phosphate 1-O-acyltransferase PlsY [Candidatus Omnitrophica bacterium]|nr:glycerol-3-phosphate 1-O-acyltransferase PlsY [Candidatus Omnitrophota bacterium]MBD3269780.1 glycerol-3-phosphate 1-O-acyltransferase PlsY [Candidatus Omnitrophota bacterium]